MSINLLVSVAQLARPTLPTASPYVFIFVCIVLIYIKLMQPNRLNQIAHTMWIEETKFDITSGLQNMGISSLLMQISYILLQTIGIWALVYSDYNFAGFLFILSIVAGIYIIQLIGFFLFSSIISQESESFFRHRITHSEFFALIYLPIFAVVTFLPYETNYVIAIIMGVCSLFSLIRSAIYLTRYISVFHNILYLCTLELVPTLFLIKLVLT